MAIQTTIDLAVQYYHKVYEDLGEFYLVKGDYARAIAFYNKAVQLQPHQPHLHRKLGFLSLLQGLEKDDTALWQKITTQLQQVFQKETPEPEKLEETVTPTPEVTEVVSEKAPPPTAPVVEVKPEETVTSTPEVTEVVSEKASPSTAPVVEVKTEKTIASAPEVKPQATAKKDASPTTQLPYSFRQQPEAKENQEIQEKAPLPSPSLSLKTKLEIEKSLQLGINSHQKGKIEEAKQYYQKVLELKSDEANALRLLGIVWSQQNNYEKATFYLKKAKESNPNDALTHFHLGNVFYRNNQQLDESLRCYQKTLEIQPNYVPAYNNIGLIYQDKQNYDQAIQYFKKAIQLNPNAFDSCHNLAMVYQKIDQDQEAIQWYQKAIKIHPNIFPACLNLGKIYHQQRQWNLAKEYYYKAIKIKSNSPKPYLELGKLNQEQQEYSTALSYYKKVLDLSPNDIIAYLHLASLYQELKQDARVRECYHKALKIDAHSPEAHYHLGLFLLQQEDYQNGFQEVNYRFKLDQTYYNTLEEKVSSSIPDWQGESLKDKSIVVWSDPLIGSDILGVRFIRLLQEKEAKVTLAVTSEYESLFQQCLEDLYEYLEEKKLKIINVEDKLNDSYDYQTFIGNLYSYLEPQNIAQNVPYLFPPNPYHPDYLLPSSNCYRVGLVCTGSQDEISSTLFTGLLEINKLEVYLLELEENDNVEQVLFNLESPYNRVPICRNLSDVATLIDQLDLVITVDSSIAHLAGAMGKLTWVLLSPNHHWCWGNNRQDSFWYPGVRIFYRQVTNQWEDVIQDLQQLLKQLIQLI